jgi:vacuolar-type H+-ATPase subunit E/Vma4
MRTKPDDVEVVAKLCLDAAAGDADKACAQARERAEMHVERVLQAIREAASRRRQPRRT